MSVAPEVKGWCPGAHRPMMSGDGLVVRVRPLMGGEIGRGEASTLAVAEDRRGVRAVVAGPGGQVMSKSFGFQACLGPTVKQADVMPLCGIPSLLDAALAPDVRAFRIQRATKSLEFASTPSVIGVKKRNPLPSRLPDAMISRRCWRSTSLLKNIPDS